MMITASSFGQSDCRRIMSPSLFQLESSAVADLARIGWGAARNSKIRALTQSRMLSAKGAGGEGTIALTAVRRETPMASRALGDFKSLASASSATSALTTRSDT